MANKEISLRKFPYPYRCGLAISNDIEFFSWETFVELHEFLNTRKTTRLGEGLGLEIGDSFFMFSEDSRRSFSYFADFTGKPFQYASRMLLLMKQGYLDTLHSYGDFDERGGFNRKMAELAINELVKNNIKIEVWTNHGTEKDVQNVGFPGATYQQGDLPGSAAYHTDLTVEYGIKFFCLDNCFTNKFGYNFRSSHSCFLKQPREQLLNKAELRDRNQIYTFYRFRGAFRKAPNSANIAEQLSEKNLESLISEQSVAIVYQHLGAKRLADDRCIPNSFPYFDIDGYTALKKLAEVNRNGIIFVTTTSRLLNYCFRVNNLIWRQRKKGGHIIIEIEKVKDTVYGYYIPTKDQLSGITFYTPSPESTEIFLKNEDGLGKIPNVINGKDETNRSSISVPWKPLEWPF